MAWQIKKEKSKAQRPKTKDSYDVKTAQRLQTDFGQSTDITNASHLAWMTRLGRPPFYLLQQSYNRNDTFQSFGRLNGDSYEMKSNIGDRSDITSGETVAQSTIPI